MRKKEKEKEIKSKRKKDRKRKLKRKDVLEGKQAHDYLCIPMLFSCFCIPHTLTTLTAAEL